MIIFNEKTHTYTQEKTGKKLPSVTEILRLSGCVDYSGIPENIMSNAKNRGQTVHRATELLDSGELDFGTATEDILPYILGWSKFLAAYKPVLIASEMMVFSLKHWFAGTLDRVFKIENHITIIDIKSSFSATQGIGLQTAAYAGAYEEMTGQKIERRFGVLLNRKGAFKVEKCDCIRDWPKFKSLARNLKNGG